MALGAIIYAQGRMSRWKPDAAGRLMKAAITLFAERGYEDDDGRRDRRTRRADQEDVLPLLLGQARGAVQRVGELERVWLEATTAAPPDATPLATATAGLRCGGGDFRGAP